MKKYTILISILLIFQNITHGTNINQKIIKEFNRYYKARKRVVNKFPDAAEDKILYYTGVGLFKKKYFANALKRFMEVVYRYKKSKFRERALIFVAKCYINLEQYIFAEKEIRIYINKHRQIKYKDLLYYYRAIAAAREKRYKNAKQYFLISINESRRPRIKKRSKIKLAKVLLKLNERIKAYKHLKSVLNEPKGLNKNDIKSARQLMPSVKWQYLMDIYHQDKAISHIYHAGKKVFILTWINGIAVFDRQKGKITKMIKKEQGLISNLVRYMKEDNGIIWLCTYAGLMKYIKSTGGWYHVRGKGAPKYTLKTVEISKKYVWVGTLTKGLYRFNKRTKNWKRFHTGNGCPGNAVVGLKLYRDKLWVATLDGGLGYYNERLKRWENYSAAMARNYRDIKCLEVNSRYVFFGTFKHGLFVYDKKTLDWKHFTKHNSPLTSNNLLSMKLVGNKLYIGTYNGGVTIINLKGTWKWSRLSIRHGLPSMDITSIQQEGDFLWFGTINSGVGIMVNL